MPDGFEGFWGSVFEGDFKGAANIYKDAMQNGIQDIMTGKDIIKGEENLVKQNVSVAKPFWNAVSKGDFAGAIEVYKNNIAKGLDEFQDLAVVKNYQDTNKPILDAVRENGIQGLPKGFKNQFDEAKEELQELDVVKNYQETNKPILDAMSEKGIMGLPEGFKNQLDKAINDFKDNCGEHISNACDKEITPPSATTVAPQSGLENEVMRR